MSSKQVIRPNTSVDTVILTVKEDQLHVLTIKRNEQPFKDQWSLVGGFVDIEKDDTLEQTARRKLFDKTGVSAPYLEQYLTLGNATRDPRGWSISTVYLALIASEDVILKADVDAPQIRWSLVKNNKVPGKLAFDHADILAGCLERLRTKVLYSILPVYLLPEDFTLSELQHVYEIIMGKSIDRKSFYRRFLGANVLEETGEQKPSGRRPAKIYRLKKRKQPYYFSRSFG